ncbi:hypothetical protein FRC02_006178 [Tulasnella sp. 418]|nr:hypothetical protein FRC02_006178 [Tulasnella sp. 418]
MTSGPRKLGDRVKDLFRNPSLEPSGSSTREDSSPLITTPSSHSAQRSTSLSEQVVNQARSPPISYVDSTRQAPVMRVSRPPIPQRDTPRHWLAHINGDLWQFRSIREQAQAQQASDPAEMHHIEPLPLYTPPTPPPPAYSL